MTEDEQRFENDLDAVVRKAALARLILADLVAHGFVPNEDQARRMGDMQSVIGKTREFLSELLDDMDLSSEYVFETEAEKEEMFENLTNKFRGSGREPENDPRQGVRESEALAVGQPSANALLSSVEPSEIEKLRERTFAKVSELTLGRLSAKDVERWYDENMDHRKMPIELQAEIRVYFADPGRRYPEGSEYWFMEEGVRDRLQRLAAIFPLFRELHYQERAATSNKFEGLSPIQRARLSLASTRENTINEIHALTEKPKAQIAYTLTKLETSNADQRKFLIDQFLQEKAKEFVYNPPTMEDFHNPIILSAHPWRYVPLDPKPRELPADWQEDFSRMAGLPTVRTQVKALFGAFIGEVMRFQSELARLKRRAQTLRDELALVEAALQDSSEVVAA